MYVNLYRVTRVSQRTECMRLFVGPSRDHTTGSGKYIFIEASSPQKVNDSAMISSPTVNSDSDFCLNFWYAWCTVLVGFVQSIAGSGFTNWVYLRYGLVSK